MLPVAAKVAAVQLVRSLPVVVDVVVDFDAFIYVFINVVSSC
jgi:hypothetical protein